MRRGLLPLAAGALALGPLLTLWACGGNGGASQPSSDDGAADATPEAVEETLADDTGDPEGGASCTVGLSGMTSDPVALCFQGDLLTAEVSAAYVTGIGVAHTWDDSGRTNGHAWQDDLGLASAIASFLCGAEFYGSTQYESLGATLGDLGGVLANELATPPPGYDGDIYFRLRNAEAGFNFGNDTAHAAALGQLADAYGRAIQKTYARSVPPSGDGGGAPGIVLGTPDPDGGIDYAPDQVIMGAAALLDMVVLHANDPDAGVDPASWKTTALAAVAYVWNRARDPGTGLFYQSLVTSGDPGHDALQPGGSPTSDALLTDVQAAAVLGFARVQDRLDTLAADDDAGPPDAISDEEPYLAEADAIVQALTSASAVDAGDAGAQASTPLWDGADSAVANPGAYLEGVVPSLGGAFLTNKTTLSAAFLLGGVHRLAAVRGTTASFVVPQLRAALVQNTPGNSSLFTVVTGAGGIPAQDGFLRASSRTWGYATLFEGPGAGEGGGAQEQEEQGAREYRADAINAVVEGLNQLWQGSQNAPLCAP